MKKHKRFRHKGIRGASLHRHVLLSVLSTHDTDRQFTHGLFFSTGWLCGVVFATLVWLSFLGDPFSGLARQNRTTHSKPKLSVHYLIASTSNHSLIETRMPLKEQVSNLSTPCVQTKTKPPFLVCTYEKQRDKYISAALQTDGIWEPHITPVIQSALDKCLDCVFIDVGAHFGYYSLLAARMDHHVIALEPNTENFKRLKLGIILNHLQSHIRVFKNAVYDSHANVTLTNSVDNQGGLWIKSIISKSKGFFTNGSLTEAITMDHLLITSNVRKAILKLDVGE